MLARGSLSIGSELPEQWMEKHIQTQRKDIHKKRKSTELDIKRSLLKKKSENGPNYDVDPADGTNFKDVFKTSLFIGDSITNGLAYYKHLAPENVIADIGQDLLVTMQKKLETIAKSQADHVYIMLGMNDAVYVDDPELFAKRYKNLLLAIREKLPETKLHILSILPVHAEDNKRLQTLAERVGLFNEALVKLSKESDIPYVDLRPFIEAHPDFYAKDGLHVARDFYRYWLKFIQENYF